MNLGLGGHDVNCHTRSPHQCNRACLDTHHTHTQYLTIQASIIKLNKLRNNSSGPQRDNPSGPQRNTRRQTQTRASQHVRMHASDLAREILAEGAKGRRSEALYPPVNWPRQNCPSKSAEIKSWRHIFSTFVLNTFSMIVHTLFPGLQAYSLLTTLMRTISLSRDRGTQTDPSLPSEWHGIMLRGTQTLLASLKGSFFNHKSTFLDICAESGRFQSFGAR